MARVLAVELKGVEKRYAKIAALDLDARRGETTVLLGPSGCGKSTLLRLVNGLVRADAGQVTVLGEALDDRSVQSLRLRMGYVIQEGGLFPHLSARDNVALLPRWLKWDEARIARRTGELMKLVHLDGAILDRHPQRLSGGQRQRVALMRALVTDPEMLLLDEPLGALDPLVRAELVDELSRIFRELNKTVLLVTHDLGEAARFAGTVVLMKDGAIAARGSLADLDASADPFVKRFLSAQRSLRA
jgi:osmoprotectant transport system ATP-binding protein